MSNWKDYLTPDERLELRDIAERKAEGQKQYRRIYERCHRRARKEKQ